MFCSDNGAVCKRIRRETKELRYKEREREKIGKEKETNGLKKESAQDRKVRDSIASVCSHRVFFFILAASFAISLLGQRIFLSRAIWFQYDLVVNTRLASRTLVKL